MSRRLEHVHVHVYEDVHEYEDEDVPGSLPR
jgi:hypothetical protein